MFSNKIDHVYGHDFEHNLKLQVKFFQAFDRGQLSDYLITCLKTFTYYLIK